jgi:hypothetical protein
MRAKGVEVEVGITKPVARIAEAALGTKSTVDRRVDSGAAVVKARTTSRDVR